MLILILLTIQYNKTNPKWPPVNLNNLSKWYCWLIFLAPAERHAHLAKIMMYFHWSWNLGQSLSFIHSFIQNMDSATFISLSRDISLDRQNWSSPTAWHDLQGAIEGRSHILSSSLRVWWVHLFFSIQFCRHTWLAGIIRSPIFRHLAWVQPHSKFSDRFTEGSAPTYVTSMLTGRSQIKSSPEII